MEENSSKKRNIATAAAAVALAAVLLVSGTFAYLQAASEDVENTFQTNAVGVTLTETTGDSYEIIPGTSQEKDPTVTVAATVATYAYLIVEDNTYYTLTDTDGNSTTTKLVEYEIDTTVWTKLFDAGDNGNPSGYVVYYAVVTEEEGEATSTTTDEDGNTTTTSGKSLNVLENKSISYSASLTNEDMLIATTSTTTDDDGDETSTTTYSLRDGITLSFTAFAVQQEPFSTNHTTTDSDGNTVVDNDAAAAEAFPYAYGIPTASVEDVTDTATTIKIDMNTDKRYTASKDIIVTPDILFTYSVVESDVDSAYLDWYCDYVITFEENSAGDDIGIVAIGGQYDAYDEEVYYPIILGTSDSDGDGSWDGVSDTEEYWVLRTQMKDFLGSYYDSCRTYNFIKNTVKEFTCGTLGVLDLTSVNAKYDFNVPSGTKITVSLVLYQEDSSGDITNRVTVHSYTYTYGSGASYTD